MHFTSLAKIFSSGLETAFASSGQKKILISLSGVGLLSFLLNDDQAVKKATGLAVQNSFVDFATGAAWLLVLDQRVIIDHARAGTDVETFQEAICVFAAHAHMDGIADLRAFKKKNVRLERRRFLDVHLNERMVRGFGSLMDQLIVI